MSDRMEKLPPLDLVRGFVAVARRMSFTRAAEDMFLTQSAVSRQVKNLEQFLGVHLLVRGHRSIQLTENGHRLFRMADGWLHQLAELTASMRQSEERRPVTVTASLGVTSLWLVPRLGMFQHAYPTVDVRVAASNKLLNLEQEDIDVAIRYCRNADAPESAIRLFGETVVPVAHPALKIKDVEARGVLEKHILLELDEPKRQWLQWSDWLNNAGRKAGKPKGILRFNQYDQVIQAALAGHGIALGRLPLVQSLIARGQLVPASKKGRTVDDYGYWLIVRSASQRKEVEEFVDWIRAEAAEIII